MRITGLPHSRRRRNTLRRISPESTSSIPSTVRMGTKPEYSGMAPSCMGMAARLATSMVTTNSDASIWPICRLPMSRMERISTRYSSNVRK